MPRLTLLLVVVLCLIATACSGDELPVDDRTIRIMPLGDSITEGSTADSTYRSWLWRELVANGHVVDFVGTLHGVQEATGELDFDADHEGHWGWRADRVRKRVDRWTRATKPDIVLLHLGHNDLWMGQSVESTVEEIADIVAIVRRSQAHTTFLMAQIVPSSLPGLEVIHEFNRQIEVLAERLSTPESPVIAVDLASGFDPLQDTVDGVHPNESGARKMAAAWLHALEGQLPQKP